MNSNIAAWEDEGGAVRPEQKQTIDEILESAAVLSWKDLMTEGPGSLLHIEYQITPVGTLDYVQYWASVKWGYWLLACTYWMSGSKSHGKGIHFDNGYESERLRSILEVVMQNQHLFSVRQPRSRSELLQVSRPTRKETELAAALVRDAFGRVNSITTVIPSNDSPEVPKAA
jgi:hypothetical protein